MAAKISVMHILLLCILKPSFSAQEIKKKIMLADPENIQDVVHLMGKKSHSRNWRFHFHLCTKIDVTQNLRGVHRKKFVQSSVSHTYLCI